MDNINEELKTSPDPKQIKNADNIWEWDRKSINLISIMLISVASFPLFIFFPTIRKCFTNDHPFRAAYCINIIYISLLSLERVAYEDTYFEQRKILVRTGALCFTMMIIFLILQSAGVDLRGQVYWGFYILFVFIWFLAFHRYHQVYKLAKNKE